MSAIETSMVEATNAAKETKQGQNAGTALAVVFVSVYALKSSIDKTKPRAHKERVVTIDKKIKDFCEGIKSSVDYHALAWCFPKETRTLPPNNRKYYPGITMLVKNIDFE